MIQGFLKRPRMLSREEFEHAPHVVAMRRQITTCAVVRVSWRTCVDSMRRPALATRLGT